MRIETLATGDELLTGLTSDTNSRFFQALLLEKTGLTVRRSTVVGDHHDDLVEAIRGLAQRCDVVLVSGGLGPTTDDITLECAAEAAGVALTEDASVIAHIEQRFAARSMRFTENNRRQARLPAGASAVLNAEGSAPLVIQTIGRCTFFFVPGVPREYRHLVGSFVVPKIAGLAGQPESTTRLRLLKTMGIPESHLDALMQPLLPQHPLVTFGYRTHAPENHLKLLVSAKDGAEAEAALRRAEVAARDVLGQSVFGVDDATLQGVLAKTLVAKQLTLAVAESCTGGLVSAALTDVSGASAWFLGGAATYAELAKQRWAKVDATTLSEHGAVSEATARAMAVGVSDALGTSCGLSVTGYAGPTGGDAQNPVGTVFIGAKTPNGVIVERFRFVGDRERVRTFAAGTALDVLRRALI